MDLDTLDAKRLLGLTSQVYTKPEVLRAFRTYVFMHHQDTSGENYDMDLAVRAKELLIKTVTTHDREPTAANGVPLSEFGNGIPYPKSGKECVYCKGKGYIREVTQPNIKCPQCEKYKEEYHGGILHVSVGRFFCNRCKGAGWVRSARAQVYIRSCSFCQGCGEIEIFNPMIPKGAILAMGGTK